MSEAAGAHPPLPSMSEAGWEGVTLSRQSSAAWPASPASLHRLSLLPLRSLLSSLRRTFLSAAYRTHGRHDLDTNRFPSAVADATEGRDFCLV